jgi:hypothetical protein
MIKRKTVLVLGAGASAPYGFPTGIALVRGVRALAGSLETGNWCGGFLEFVQHNRPKEVSFWGDLRGQMKVLSGELDKARPPSIDQFLELRPDIADVGKLVIGILLLRAEGKSTERFQSDATEGHWYDFLKSQLLSSTDVFEQNQIRVITFNYERSLEYYLFDSLWPCYCKKMTEDEYREAMNKIYFLHVYGSLGPLPWQSQEDAVQYGSYDYGQILAASMNIKVLHEGEGDGVTANFSKACEWLGWADRVLFLGFGFHPDNVARLRLSEKLRRDQEIQATCKHLVLTNRDNVEFCTSWALRPKNLRKDLDPICAVQFPEDREADCYALLHDYVVLS